MKISLIGAGAVGKGLGHRLAAANHEICVGVRDVTRGSGLREAIPNARVLPSSEAVAGAEIVFLAVPGAATVEVARGLGSLAGKILVDCNNPVRWDGGPVWAPPAEGSLSAALAAACPGACVVKAFNTFGAEFHADPQLAHGERADVLMASDDAPAKQTVAALARSAGFVPVDAGPLRNAALLEAQAILWIHLALVGGQGREFCFKMLRR
jgi:hypothetical protein